MKKACIVGYGNIGPIHAAALEKISVEYSVCDNDAEKLKRINKSSVETFTSFNSVLDNPDISVVHICTPHYLHKEMAIAAMKRGKAVVLEKPAAMNLAELSELESAQKELNGKICVVLQNRTNPSFVELQKRIETDKELGEVIQVSGILMWHRDAEYYRSDAWRGKKKTEGGGLLINQAIHLIDLLSLLGNGITAVRGSISNKTLEGVIEVEDTADAMFKTNSGINMCFYATNGCTLSRPMLLEVQLKNGVLRYADDRLYRITGTSCETVAYDFGERIGKPYWGCGHAKVISDFYNYLSGGNNSYITLQDAASAMKALYAFYESAEQNKEISI